MIIPLSSVYCWLELFCWLMSRQKILVGVAQGMKVDSNPTNNDIKQYAHTIMVGSYY